MKTLRKKRIAGFTIIELMITLVIISILVAIAYPSYVNYLRKSKRGEAQQLLMNWAINQEIFRSNNSAYAAEDSLVLPKPVHQDGKYNFRAYLAMATPATCTGPSGTPNGTAYWLVAEAQGDQAKDEARGGISCAVLCLSGAGPKQPAACWD